MSYCLEATGIALGRPASLTIERASPLARRWSAFSLLLSTAALFATCLDAHAAGYTYTDLGALAGTSSRAFGINSIGQVVGDSNLSRITRGTMWNGATPTTLESVGTSYATAINNLGQAAGFGDGRAILWNGTTPTYLGASGETGVAYGINDAGQVVGQAYAGSDWHATRWTTSTTTDLGTLGGSNSYAAGIMNRPGF